MPKSASGNSNCRSIREQTTSTSLARHCQPPNPQPSVHRRTNSGEHASIPSQRGNSNCRGEGKLIVATQLALDGNETAVDDAASEEEEESQDDPETPPHKPRRQKRHRFDFPQCLPVKRIEYPLTPEELTTLYGGSNWQLVKEVVTRRLEFTAASAYVLEEVRYVYAAAENSDGPLMATSEKPPSINEKGVFGPTAIAYLAQ